MANLLLLRNGPKAIEFGEITQNTGHHAIQCHSRSLILVPVESPYTGWAKKSDHFLKCITLLHSDIGRNFVYQNVQLFIRRKNVILNAALFKYSLHKVRETILH